MHRIDAKRRASDTEVPPVWTDTQTGKGGSIKEGLESLGLHGVREI